MNQTTTLNVLITGCSSGFGKLIAKTLAKDGHHVFASMRGVNGKNADAARQLLEWRKQEGVSLEVVELDVTDDASVEKAVQSILDTANQIDVVVNNAGVVGVGVLEAFTLEQTQALFDVNTFGALRVNRAVLPGMRERKSGLLIHISSTAGRITPLFAASYAATKFALETLAESLRFELAAVGIDSVIIEPGAYPTESFNKVVLPADSKILAGYGDLAAMPAQMLAGVGEIMSGPNAPNAQDVADAVKKLIDTPFGERPLRTVVGTLVVAGVESLNQAYEQSKQQMLESIGLAN